MNENSSLHLYFMEKDQRYTVNNVVVDESAGNYISNTFVNTPVYDLTNKEMGYNVTNRHVEKNGLKYSVRLSSTYYIYGKGSIRWNHVFEHDRNDNFYPEGHNFYPIDGVIDSSIISTLGDYYGKTGTISLFPKEYGLHIVNIVFNN